MIGYNIGLSEARGKERERREARSERGARQGAREARGERGRVVGRRRGAAALRPYWQRGNGGGARG